MPPAGECVNVLEVSLRPANARGILAAINAYPFARHLYDA